MQEDSTFKQLLCPLLVVNTVSKMVRMLRDWMKKKKFYKLNTPFHINAVSFLCTLSILTHSHKKVRQRSVDEPLSVSAYLLGAQGILHLLITQDVLTSKSFKITSILNNSCCHAAHTCDFAIHQATLAEQEPGRAGSGSNVTKTRTAPWKQCKTNLTFLRLAADINSLLWACCDCSWGVWLKLSDKSRLRQMQLSEIKVGIMCSSLCQEHLRSYTV